MRKLIIAGAVVIGLTAATAGPALAVTNPNYPTVCDAGHGAPGGYPAYPTSISNQQDPGFGHEQNPATGPGTGDNNSALGQACAPGRAK